MTTTFLAQLRKARQASRVAQAYLLVSPEETLADEACAVLCCLRDFPYACGQCQGCQWLAQQGHPDVQFVSPEKSGGTLGIEKIRDLQTHLYVPPQSSAYRIIILQHADKLTVSAANAFLKILEEPPPSVCFMLLAEQTSMMLPTILSRCQRWYCQSLVQPSPPEIVAGLVSLMSHEGDPYQLAAMWSTTPFSVLIEQLYGATTELIRTCALQKLPQGLLFRQLDRLHDILRNINHTIAMQPLLTLEDLLLGYQVE